MTSPSVSPVEPGAGSGVRERLIEAAALTWDELLDHCSRLHTTRRRSEGPWADAEMREDSQMLDITVEGIAATVVPTGMHEPGFYVRGRHVIVGPRREGPAWSPSSWILRSDKDLAMFHRFVDSGFVYRAADGAR